MVRARDRLRSLIASLAVGLLLAAGLVSTASPAYADTPSPGWGAYTPGTVAVLGRLPDLIAAGFLVDDNGTLRPSNYDRTKFSVLMIDKWSVDENKAFINNVVKNRAPVFLVSPVNSNSLWATNRDRPAVFYTELHQLRAGGYPIGWGNVAFPNGRVTNLPEMPPQVLVHPDAPVNNSTIVAALNDPVVVKQIGHLGGSLLFPAVMQGLVNGLVNRGLIDFQTGQMAIEISNCVQSLLYLDQSVRGAANNVVRSIGPVFSVGSGIISGALACKEQLARLGFELDNTTLGLLHIADCLTNLPAAATGIGIILTILNCVHDADMAAYYLQGTIMDRALGDFIKLMFRSLPEKSPYRQIDPQLYTALQAQFPGPSFARVEVSYQPGVTVQVARGPNGLVTVSVTRLQFLAMMLGYQVTGIVMDGPEGGRGKKITVDPFPSEFVAWCVFHPTQCRISNEGEFIGPSPKEVLNIVKQEGQGIAGNGQSPNRLQVSQGDERDMQLKFPEVQKAVVNSSYSLCVDPNKTMSCAGTAPAARPGQEPPGRAIPSTGDLHARQGGQSQDTVQVTMQVGHAVRMTINGQPVTGTFVLTDSSNRWVALVVSDGNVQMTYIPDNDMAIRRTEFGWIAQWTDANGRTWTAKSRMSTVADHPTLEVYEVSTIITDPATGNETEVTIRLNPNVSGPRIAQERIYNRATGVEIIKDNMAGLTYRIFNQNDPQTDGMMRVMEVYRNGVLERTEVISKDEEGDGQTDSDRNGFFTIPAPEGGGSPTTCIGIPTNSGGSIVRCDRGDGRFVDPTDPMQGVLPGEDIWCGKYGLGSFYGSVAAPLLSGCRGETFGFPWGDIGARIEAWIWTQLHIAPMKDFPVFELEEVVSQRWERLIPQRQRESWLAFEDGPVSFTAVDAGGDIELHAGENVRLTGSGLGQATGSAPENPAACQESFMGLKIGLFGESIGGHLTIDGPTACITYVSPTEVRFRLGDNVPEDRYVITIVREGSIEDTISPRHTGAVTITNDPTAPRVTVSGSPQGFTFVPGQAPTYSVTKAEPNKPICWQSTKDGVAQETNVCSGQTDANGKWSGPGPAIQAGQAGVWIRRATVAGRTSATGTSAHYRVAAQCEYTWTGTVEFGDGARHLGCGGTLRFSGGNVTVEDVYGIPRWSSGSTHSPPGRLVFQGAGDGNLVVYNASNQVVWTAGREAPGGQFRLRNDGTLALTNANGQVVWTSTNGGSLDSPVTVSVQKGSYGIGEVPTFTVTGPAFQPIRWRKWMDGVEQITLPFGPLQYTDGTGRWSGPGQAERYTEGWVGTWQWQATIAGRSSQPVAFNVTYGPAHSRIPVTLAAVHSGLCMDIPGGSTSNGQQMYQWGCHNGGNQQWVLDRQAADTYLIRSVYSGKCLDVAGGSMDNGGIVQQYDCHGGPNQLWRLNANPEQGQAVTIQSVNSGKCIDVYGWSTGYGGWIYQWDCQGGGNQQWRINQIGSSPVPQCGYTWFAQTNKLFVPNESYTGCNGTLVMQGDGNLVIYSPSGRALWASNTAGWWGAYAIYMSNGDLQIWYPQAAGGRIMIWDSGTWLGGPGTMVFGDNGNLAVYSTWGFPFFQTYTYGDPPPPEEEPPPPPPDPCQVVYCG